MRTPTAKLVTWLHTVVVVPILDAGTLRKPVTMMDVGTLRKPVTMMDVGTLRKPVTGLDVETLRKPVTMLHSRVVLVLDVGTQKAKPVTAIYSYTYDT